MSDRTSGEEEDLASWRNRLQALDAELAERDAAAAAAGGWSPEELAALAKEHDSLADQWDELATARDTVATDRDTSAEAREATATGRDRRARARTGDSDDSFPDRFLSARDRDDAAGDRSESLADRRHGASDRARAGADRSRAAADRERADRRNELADQEIAGLRTALESRHMIGLAQGVLMERYNVDVDRAFQMLVALSTRSNRKLRDIAALLAMSERRTLEQAGPRGRRRLR